MRIGYARTSTDDPHLDLQREALGAAGCQRVYEDAATGTKAERRGLAALLGDLNPGDTVVVWRLDRLARSMKDLLRLVERFEAVQAGLCSLHENIDTDAGDGRLIFPLFGVLADFERNILHERAHAAMTTARARGRQGGRPPLLDDAARAMALQLHREGRHTVDQICKTMGISRSTLYNYLDKAEHDLLLASVNRKADGGEPSIRMEISKSAIAN